MNLSNNNRNSRKNNTTRPSSSSTDAKLLSALQTAMDPANRQLTMTTTDQVCAAAFLGDDKLVQILLTSGASINHCSMTGWTALHEAVNGHHHKTVELLLSKGGDLTVASTTGKTALELAIDSGDAKSVHLLHLSIESSLNKRLHEAEKQLNAMKEARASLSASASATERLHNGWETNTSTGNSINRNSNSSSASALVQSRE